MQQTAVFVSSDRAFLALTVATLGWSPRHGLSWRTVLKLEEQRKAFSVFLHEPDRLKIGKSTFQRGLVMALPESLFAPLVRIIDRVVPDTEARDRAKLELLKLESLQEIARVESSVSAIIAEGSSADPWTSRARPTFLYVMYIVILWALPMGLISAFDPTLAKAIGDGMNSYLAGLPEPLYVLFGTGYLGYSAMRQWGKGKGSDR
ncbi:holin family protein [Novosphingobium panipatense]|nr:holin family protein [Novosphingobium panipatense]